MNLTPKTTPSCVLEGNSNSPKQIILLTNPVSSSRAPGTSVGVFTTSSVISSAKTPKITNGPLCKSEPKTLSVLKPAIARKQVITTQRLIAPKPAIALETQLPNKISSTLKTANSSPSVTPRTKKGIPVSPPHSYKERSESTWPRRVVKHFIALLKERPCLYDNQNPSFSIKYNKFKAMEEISKELAPLRPNTTVEDVKKKLKSLRQQFLAAFLLRKKNDEQYHEVSSKCWLYDHMKFLLPHMKYGEKFLRDKQDNVEADTSEDVEEVLQVTSSSKHALRGDESLEHSYCMEPNCELEDREELAALPVQSTSPNRKRMREDSFTEDGNSREISDSSETPVDNTSVMASFFDYLLAECSQIEDPDVLNNLKTNLFYVVMESVKLDISKRTPSSPSF